MECEIKLTWDADALVWVATSNNIPGLVLESGSVDALIERVKTVIPELLELNKSVNTPLNLSYHTYRTDRLLFCHSEKGIPTNSGDKLKQRKQSPWR